MGAVGLRRPRPRRGRRPRVNDREAMARLDELLDVQRGVVRGLTLLDTKLGLLSDQVGRLVAVLTPDTEKQDKGGLTVAEVLAAMVGRLDKQVDLMKDVADTVSRAVVEIPAAVVDVLRDTDAGDDRPPRRAADDDGDSTR